MHGTLLLNFPFPFLAYFPHFEKMKVPCCLCVCVSPLPVNFWMPEPIFMKLGMYMMTREAIRKAYFTNLSHQSVSVRVSPYRCYETVRQKTLPWKRIHMQHWTNCWAHRFLFGPCRFKGKWAVSCSQDFFQLMTLSLSRLRSVGDNGQWMWSGWRDEKWQGKPCPNATLPAQILGSTPGCRGEKPCLPLRICI
jgi:hypothetical protein